jgi:membrane-associated protein
MKKAVMLFWSFAALLTVSVLPAAVHGGDEGPLAGLPSAEEVEAARIMYDQALTSYQSGDFAQARDSYQRIVLEHPRTQAGRKAQLRLILVFVRLGDYPEATKQAVKWFINFFLHLDRHLNDIVGDFKAWTYLLLFLIIFCETGLVVTPILPGDSLLFAAGALSAMEGSPLRIELLFLLLAIAAVGGDTVNYWIGHLLGPKVFKQEKSLFFKKEYLERTHRFYEKYGGKTIIIARFIPIIRTFAPFVAGIGAMSYGKFISYNVIGGVAWIAAFLLGGHYFGNIPMVKKNFTFVIIAIIIISVMPPVIEYLRQRFGQPREGDAA